MIYIFRISAILIVISYSNTGFSQLISNNYYGDYSSIYRIVDTYNCPELISKNRISEIEVISTINENIKIGFTSFYDTDGNFIKTNAKKARIYPKLTGKYYWLTGIKKNTKKRNEVTGTDSIVDNVLIGKRVGSTVELYNYDQNGNLIRINLYYHGISTAPRIKEIKLDYNQDNKVKKEEVIWLAGDSTIVFNNFENGSLKETKIKKYRNEQISLGGNKFEWRVSSTPIVEAFRYYYLANGLIDYIEITDSELERIMTFKYK